MASASTYTPIATQTLGSNASSVTFSSIPSTYTDLVLIGNGTSVGNQTAKLTFNGTSSGYSDTDLFGDGSSAGSLRRTNANALNDIVFYTNPTMFIVDIMNYANTNVYKTTLAKTTIAGAELDIMVGLWQNTAAINSLTLTGSSTNFVSGSTFTLYGILAA